jgi:PIN domain nuclease of toxin-antitoxin system
VGLIAAGAKVAILDASALIAFFADEPARPEVERLLNRSGTHMSAVNVAEVYDRLIRLRGVSRQAVEGRFDVLHRYRALKVVPLEDPLAARAGELRAVHYHGVERPVSLADCAAAATAESLDTALATSDPKLIAMARDEGMEVISLPSSSGRRTQR